MGKKKQAPGLGRAVVKSRFGGGRQRKGGAGEFVHTSELQDGPEWNQHTLDSVTDQNHLDEFLTTAQLAGTEFAAERLNATIVNPGGVGNGLPSIDEERMITSTQEDNRQFLTIPRRPEWNREISAEELDKRERESFLSWRRQLVELEDKKHILLTPFEKNLEFWRQLWRVVERSDVVVQIVDARNPLLFRCADLEKYVLEVDPLKVNLVLVNKADLLTPEQRNHWANYFNSIGVRAIFWSALIEKLQNEKGESEEVEMEEDLDDEEDDDDDDNDEKEKDDDEDEKIEEDNKMTEDETVSEAEMPSSSGLDNPDPENSLCNPKLVSGEELLDIVQALHPSGITTVGLVGYPNVGKSSTINAILQTKKVPVSATPGRTKHFQTIQVTPTLTFCDCPGLVMPSFVSTQADMVINGILPIDQMRDCLPPITLVCRNIPRLVLEATYGVNIPQPKEGEDPKRPPTAMEFLTAYGYIRGFMSTKGVPDTSRAARLILKDYVSGRLLFSYPPPGVSMETFGSAAPATEQKQEAMETRRKKVSYIKPTQSAVASSVDKAFFAKRTPSVGVKGKNVPGKFPSQLIEEKPWRKHGNRNKKEKLRRMHRDLDQHDIYS